MSLRKFIAYSLLVAFSVLLTPREWWHECDHHSVENGLYTSQIDQDDCSICDYHIAVWSLPSDLFRGNIPFIKYQKPFYWLGNKPNYFSPYTALRGPPVA